MKPAVASANQDYEKHTAPGSTMPSPPMHAAGLAALVKKLAVAEGAVAESIKARQALVAGLEKLLETSKAKLENETAQMADLKMRKDAIESRKRKVEEAILKGLSAAETNKISAAAPLPAATTAPVSQERPQVEELTPPPMESFTPTPALLNRPLCRVMSPFRTLATTSCQSPLQTQSSRNQRLPLMATPPSPHMPPRWARQITPLWQIC
jgi:regulator of Ty1 transposition protein 103